MLNICLIEERIRMETKYGFLDGVEEAELYSNGSLKSCKITVPHVFKTKIGELSAQHETIDERRKMTGCVEFYKNGDLMSISLDRQIEVSTAAGKIPAEKIMFYEGETIKRIFPLNGKLSGYWGEENEYGLAKEITINVGEKIISCKFISVAFYENSGVKSLTLWPKEKVMLETACGGIKIRKGVSFYENANIKSIEPATEIKLNTPIGIISAFNNEINGLNGDINSIKFNSDGSIKTLYTCSSEIRITENINTINIFPEMKTGWCNELIKIPSAIKIDFTDELVIFNEKQAFNYKKCKFQIRKFEKSKVLEEIVC